MKTRLYFMFTFSNCLYLRLFHFDSTRICCMVLVVPALYICCCFVFFFFSKIHLFMDICLHKPSLNNICSINFNLMQYLFNFFFQYAFCLIFVLFFFIRFHLIAVASCIPKVTGIYIFTFGNDPHTAAHFIFVSKFFFRSFFIFFFLYKRKKQKCGVNKCRIGRCANFFGIDNKGP